jgi:predicted peptidase
MPIRDAVTRHGPLAGGSSPIARNEFIVVAPQLPACGDLWHRYADAVDRIVFEAPILAQADRRRVYLTGFSFGGNGVFDLALSHPARWAALWPVDPTRVPGEDLGRPVWLSSGAVSRPHRQAYVERLRLEFLQGRDPGDRVYLDDGQDHVGTARLAYQDDRIYRWLLSRATP